MRFPAAAVLFELAFQRAGDAGVRAFIRSLGSQDVTLERLAIALRMAPSDVEAQFQAVLRTR